MFTEDKVLKINEIEYILLNVVEAEKQKYGILAKKNLLDKFLNNDKKVFVDYDVFLINDISVDEADGEFQLNIIPVEELTPSVYEKIYNAKNLALEKLQQHQDKK